MRAELILWNKPVNLSLRRKRRVLVVCIYAGMTMALAGLGMLDHWRTSGYYLVFLALGVNHFLLGGYGRGGLVRPFSKQAPRRASVPSPLIPLGLYLRLTRPAREEEWRSDERETALRDRVHFQAYQGLSVAICVLWILTGWETAKSASLPALHAVAAEMLYPVVLVTVVLMLTLPQAILLWNEPDMDESSLGK